MICCSIKGQTIEEFEKKIKEVKHKVEIIELRFDDFLPTIKQCRFLARLVIPGLLIVTVRNPERLFSQKFLFLGHSFFTSSLESSNNILIDIDFKYVGYFLKSGFPPQHVIASYHNYNNINDLENLFHKIKDMGTRYIKIAVTPTNLSDLVKLSTFAQKICLTLPKTQNLIIVGMGKLGILVRILYKRFFNSLWTYCCIKKSEETAPGQPTIDELLNIYRIKNIDDKTKIYGILGHNIEHSLSPIYYNKSFAKKGINSVYLPIDTSSITGIKKFISKFGFQGLSITSPYKDKLNHIITNYAQDIKGIKIVNTITIERTRLQHSKPRIYGYNTDMYAILNILKHHIHSYETILILGSGAMAKITVYTLLNFFNCANIKNIYIYSQHKFSFPKKCTSSKLKVIFLTRLPRKATFDLIINCSKFGFDNTKNHFYEKVLNFITKETVCVELNYRIEKTPLILRAKEIGAKYYTGIDFFQKQFQEQFKILLSC